MLMNDNIMFDRYYCINSKKTHRKLRKCSRTLFFSLITIVLRAQALYKYPRFGPWPGTFSHDDLKLSKKISNDQELIQSDPISCPQNQKGNN